MTPDQLRCGAALVRALVEGDDSARGPLSDWIWEHGLPDCEDYETAEALALLRSDRVVYTLGHDRPHPKRVLLVADLPGNRRGTESAWLGTWPALAWEPEA